MNGGTSLFVLFFLLAVNLSLFTEGMYTDTGGYGYKFWKRCLIHSQFSYWTSLDMAASTISSLSSLAFSSP
uniref:Candidate secreted effector n=1 Tax=Meloidogyne incognita TaxID=6306 RepID=A0A914KIX5_MELIC